MLVYVDMDIETVELEGLLQELVGAIYELDGIGVDSVWVICEVCSKIYQVHLVITVDRVFHVTLVVSHEEVMT